ncbi:hypothetical protein HOG17_01250 [Candidatus Peregrinibacteria bacterium]|jgi:hypothetical protein|nr:hypothetical protein [Candidatus Peregrinibacteria bacterium]MBT4147951.1 hypothetical protein [Candidatus Peregrinibacteria bacterium]MBT4366298.1 hypothetical protein [Candidatus Peregrinibacteria bacterium]MBT4456171.1 hypothetical protein [Candidatus Peregrinibacteria bacterium]
MKEEIIALIEKSEVISSDKKDVYLKFLDFLPEDKLTSLLDVLKKEQKGREQVMTDAEKKQSDINQKYIDKADQLVCKEEKKAFRKEERKEKIRANSILDELEHV